MREKENSGIRRAPGAGAVDAADFASPIEGGVAAGSTDDGGGESAGADERRAKGGTGNRAAGAIRTGNAGCFRNGNAQSFCGYAAAGGFDGSTDRADACPFGGSDGYSASYA